jgi:transcriptional regulator with GAF, ATPase, and Fis domain
VDSGRGLCRAEDLLVVEQKEADATEEGIEKKLSSVWVLGIIVRERLAGLVLLEWPSSDDPPSPIDEALLLAMSPALAFWLDRQNVLAGSVEDERFGREEPGKERSHAASALETEATLAVPWTAPARPRTRYEIEHGLVGSSAVFLETLACAERWAKTDHPVLILGETGTGKELIARLVHACSQRKDGPFVTVNCPAIPKDLAESELFGHERGAFTGAIESRAGKFELAEGGTLFLDEVGDLPALLQAKLLRALQEGEFERVGSGRVKKVSVRVIAATNRDLHEAVTTGEFRQDLFFRLNAMPIRVPPLRHRPGDIEVLAWHFLSEAVRKNPTGVRGFTPEAMTALKQHDWPGNVRELRHTVDRAVLNARESLITTCDLGELGGSGTERPLTLNGQLRLEKRRRVEAVLKQWRGNCAQAARELGMSRGNFARLLRALGLNAADFRNQTKSL